MIVTFPFRNRVVAATRTCRLGAMVGVGLAFGAGVPSLHSVLTKSSRQTPAAIGVSSAVAPNLMKSDRIIAIRDNASPRIYKVCKLIPASTAKSISGVAITKAAESDTASYGISECDYTNTAGTAGFNISVLTLDAVAGYQANLQGAGKEAKQIKGLGNKAFSSVEGVEALYGSLSIQVSNLESTRAGVALIRKLHAKI